MRDLKFRAWDKKEKRFMVDDAIFINVNGESFDYTDEAMVLNGWDLMQSTGLKDKNNTGVELFEGDIVDIYGTGHCIVGICPMLGVTFEDVHGDESSYHDELMGSDIGEVLGNIHEDYILMSRES